MNYQYQARQVVAQPEKAFRLGDGRISGYLALFLGGLSLAAVMAFLFPSLLTTSELRAQYDASSLQQLLKYGMWGSLGFASICFLRGKRKRMGLAGTALTTAGFMAGGYLVPVGPVAHSPVSLGLDWLILAFLGSVVIFTTLEKLFPKYRQQVILRREWQLDFGYFCLNHLLLPILLLVGNYLVARCAWAMNADLQAWVQSMPLFAQVILLLLVADFVLYWEHRLFHELRGLWRFHAVHHSVETMDWLAGSRGHVVQMFVERTLVMLALYTVGADKAALDIYVTFAALQAIVIHCNLGINWGPLKYLLVTPQYHHWHHSSEAPAIDTNYAAHTPLFDRLFGTYHFPAAHWPAHYGTTVRLPRDFVGQFFYPFKTR